VVHVHVHGGSGLKPMDDTTKDGKSDNSDPYLKLYHGDEQRRTETHALSLDPIWDEIFQFDGKGVEGDRQTLEELLHTKLELECYDENKAFGINMLANNPLLGIATVDLKLVMRSQEAPLLVPLSTQGSISLTVTWEVEEEWVDEEEEARWLREHAEKDEDVLEEIFGRGETHEEKVAAAEADSGAAKAKAEGPASPKGATAPPPKPPDMLSLSIAITILVKFVLFDLVGFFQVNSSLAGSMPDLTFPPEFGEMSRTLSSAFNLDFVTDVGEANCSLGSNHCYRIMVMMFSLLAFQLASPAGYSLAKGLQTKGIVSQKRVEALVDRCIHGNAIVIMALHPPISKKLVSIVDCTMYNDVSVLSGFKDIECGSRTCTAVALVFVCLYTLGVPIYLFVCLRAYLSPTAKNRWKGNPILARYKARIGFTCGKYEAQFWYYELLEMTRKTGLMAVTSFIRTGSYGQLFAKMLISGFFFVLLMRCSPFNSKKLFLLVITGQFCSLATLFFMLMMKIGFFEEEGVDVGVMNAILMYIMFFPLFVAVYIIGAAMHEAFAAHFRQYVWPKIKACAWAVVRKLNGCLDSQTKYAY